MVYRIPPQSFQLPCEPTGNSGFPLPITIAEKSSNEESAPTKANTTALVAEDHFLCCYWTDAYVDCFIYAAEMEIKAFTQQIGMLVEGFFKK